MTMTTLQMATDSGILGLVVKGTVLLLLGWFGALLMRRAPAGARHGLWLTAIIGVVLVPLIASVATVRLAVLPAPHASAVPASALNVPMNVGATTSGVVSETTFQTASVSGPAARSGTSVRTFALGLWLCVSAAVVAWLIVGAAKVRRVLRQARILDTADWTRSLQEASDKLKIAKRPRLLMSDEVETAFACGVFRPTIVLPRSADEWSDDRRRAVLLHEAAHIRRGDLVGHIIASLGCALYWFHPLMWVAAHHLRAESELACDDMVLDAGVRPSDYAQHLLDLVTGLSGHANTPAIALPMVRSRAFEGRMEAIFERANRWKLGHSERGLVIGLFALLTASIAAVAPVRRPVALQPRLGPASIDQTINDSVTQAQLARLPVRRATLTQERVGGATPAASVRSKRDSAVHRDRPPRSETAVVSAPPLTLAATPCQRVVGAQQVPSVVDSAYARLFDGVRLTTDQENKACEVLLRLHFEQVAADSITEAAQLAGRVKLAMLQAQRDALLRGLLTNETDRATLDAHARETPVGLGALRMPMDWAGGAGGQRGAGARGRIGGGGGGVPLLPDSVAAAVVTRGGRGGRGRGVDPSGQAEISSRLTEFTMQLSFNRLFEGIALTPEQEARAREIIKATEQEAHTVTPAPRLVRLRIPPVPGVVTLHGAGMAELMSIMSNDTDRATLQSRIIVAPR